MVVHMVGIGEETGNVEEMLTNSAVYYEEEVEVQTQTLTSLMAVSYTHLLHAYT